MCLDCRGAGAATGPAPAGRSTAALAAVPVAEGLEIFPRAAWAGDDRPALGDMPMEDVRFLLVHHTAGTSDYTPDGAIAEMQQVYGFHTGPEKGWPDVCYNFFVDRFGRVFEARTGSLAGPVVADATGGSQGFAQLVCLLGDFTDALPSPEALDALTLTLAWLAGRYRLELGLDASASFVSRGSNRWPEGTEVATNTIAGHRDMSQTACPGDTFYPYVTSTLRTDAAGRAALMSVSPAAGEPPTQSAPTSDRPAVESTPSTSLAAAVPPEASGTTTVAPGSGTGSATVGPSTSVTAAGSSERGAPDSAGPGPLGLVLGGVGAVGAVGAAAGLAWVLKRRIDNQDRR